MNKKTWIAVAILALVVVVAIIGTRKQEENTIVIGAVLCETGSGAEYGKDTRRGIELALNEINSAGGINGKKVRILFEDSQTQPKTAVSAAEKLISTNKVQVILGAVTSSSHLAISPLADKNQVVIISPGASNPNITTAGDFVFRNWISDSFEGKAMADYLWKRNVRKVAVFYLNNDYGLGLKNVFVKCFKELGGKITVIESHEQDASDFRTQLTKIVAGNPHAIYLPSYYKEMAGVVNQAAELGLNIPFYSTVTFEDPKLIELAGKNADSVVYSFPYYDPDAPDAHVKTFVSAFEKKFGRKPGIFAAHGYDAARIVFTAIAGAGNSGTVIRNALYATKHFPGVSGATTFDKNGDVEKPVSIKQVKDGKFIFLKQ